LYHANTTFAFMRRRQQSLDSAGLKSQMSKLLDAMKYCGIRCNSKLAEISELSLSTMDKGRKVAKVFTHSSFIKYGAPMKVSCPVESSRS